MHILLSRTDRIGDLILSTPAIATVRASFPQARITMVTSPYNRIAVERSTDVDEIVELAPADSPRNVGKRFRGCDIAIALAPRIQDLRVIAGTRAPLRIGYTYVRRIVARATSRMFVNRLMLSEADPDLCERDPLRVVRHEVEQLLDLVSLAGANTRISRLRLDVHAEDRAAISDLPVDPVVVHVGERWMRDGSSLESTIQLVRELREVGHPLVVTVAPETNAVASQFEAVADRVLCNLPFFTWAAVFERARCVVTVDTGATHVASAVRRPTVVAFEHRFFRLNSQEWAPYGVPHASIRKPESEDPDALAAFRAEIVRSVASLERD